MKKQITLSPEQMKIGLSEREIAEYPEWVLYSDTDDGEFDAEKGAMTDYAIYFESPDGTTYKARDGYYTAMTGEVFHGDVEFSLFIDESDYKPDYTNLIMSVRNKLDARIGYLESSIDRVEKVIHDEYQHDFLRERSAVQRECLQSELRFVEEIKNEIDNETTS